MPTTFCTRCTKQFDYNLPNKTRYVLCSYCGWGQNAASFWHSYWGGKFPSLHTIQNLSKWSQHLQNTAFLPILWTNRSAYQEICQNAERGSILTLQALCQQNQNSGVYASLFMLREKLGYNFPIFVWKTRRYTSIQGGTYAKPIGKTINAKCPLLLIDYEAFVESEINKSQNNNQKTIFKTLLKVFQTLNNNNFFAYAKDINIDLILAYLGGIYFDADISPKKNSPFFNAINDIPFNTSFIGKNMIFECLLLKFDNPNIPAYHQTNHPLLTDYGFKLYINSGDFCKTISQKDFSKVNFTVLKKLKQHIESFKVEVNKAKNNNKVFYPFIKAPLTSAATTFWMNEFKVSKERAAKKLLIRSHSPIEATTKYPIQNLFDEIKKLRQLLFEKNITTCLESIPDEDYRQFYLEYLYDKFEQVSCNEPSSTFYTGYQHLEKMKYAVDTIGEAYRK